LVDGNDTLPVAGKGLGAVAVRKLIERTMVLGISVVSSCCAPTLRRGY